MSNTAVIGAYAVAAVSIIGAIFAGLASLKANNNANQAHARIDKLVKPKQM